MRNQKKQVNYLIPELCYISGINKKDLRKIPKKSVTQKEDYITRISNKMNSGESRQFLDSVGLQIDRALETSFTVVPQPQVSGIEGMKNDKWTVSMDTVINSLQGKNWALVSPQFLVKGFMDAIGRYDLRKPYVFHFDDRGRDFMHDIEGYKNWNDLDYVFFLMANENKHIYSALKQFYNCTVGIPSQCIVCNGDWFKRLPNCLIQMSAKIGGLIWSVERSYQEFVSVCGIDIQRKGRNFKGSISLSLNTGTTLYYTVPFRESDETNIRNKLLSSIKEALQAFRNRNGGGMPSALILYNSGHDCIDISQLIHDFCLETEMEYTKVCLVSVNKDSNARFNMDNQNPPIGTVVTSMSRYQTQEFYMNSCFINSNIGYSKPVRYQVLFNNTMFSVDEIIKITFRQTHLYYNWNGSVRMPACLLYAKKSIESVDLTQEYPSTKLRNNPFFL